MFEIGNSVKVIDPDATAAGETGTVRTVETVGGRDVIDVFFPHRNNAGPIHFYPAQLERVEG